MSNKSRRRLTMAAGALLAGAAIPIAAAGTAWADDTNTDQTETAKQLEHQGLTHAEAQAVVTAEGNGTPVQVSYDGTTVVNDNQGTGPSTDASAVFGHGPKMSRPPSAPAARPAPARAQSPSPMSIEGHISRLRSAPAERHRLRQRRQHRGLHRHRQ